MGADSTGFTNHWTAATYAKATYTVYGAIQNTDSLGASSVLLMNGRRYKVAAAQEGLTAGQGLALTETFAGSSYMELCADCVKAMAATGADESGNTIDVNGNYGYGFDLKQGDQVMIGGATNFDNLLTVAVDTTGIFDDKIAARNADGTAGTAAAADGASIGVYAGAGKIGSGKGQAATAITGSNTLALYKVHNTNRQDRQWQGPGCHRHHRLEHFGPLQGAQHQRLQARRRHRVREQRQLPVRQPVLQPRRLRRLHRPLQLLQGLHQRQLRHPEHARGLNKCQIP